MLHLCDSLKHTQESFLSHVLSHTTTPVDEPCFLQNSTSHHTRLFNRFNMLTKFNRHLLGVKLAQQNGIYSAQLGFFFFISSMTVVGLIFRTRAMSRIPLPFKLISMICSLTWGNRPKSEYSRINVFPQHS